MDINDLLANKEYHPLASLITQRAIIATKVEKLKKDYKRITRQAEKEIKRLGLDIKLKKTEI